MHFRWSPATRQAARDDPRGVPHGDSPGTRASRQSRGSKVLDPVSLSPVDFERLMFALDASVSVSKRVQFFLWTQGALQNFLPHETLVCVHGDLPARRYAYEVFSRAVLGDEFNRAFGDPVGGLIPRMLDHWYANEQMPLGFDAEQSEWERTARQLGRLDLLPATVHGSRLVLNQHATLFIMLRTPQAIDVRVRYMAELLMPHLHLAWHRVLCADRDAAERISAPASPLTDREVEVLNWVREGKTNVEIAAILHLSPLTVKNHVRKILRKLKVSNRAHAVARGLSARVFRNYPEHLAGAAGPSMRGDRSS